VSVRVTECNACGHVIAAATDEDLVQRLRDHMAAEHPDAVLDEAAARELVASEAYEASDS
jgi:predicted small metal-binding protein